MLIIFLILGLIIGSFLNVLVYRIHTAEELFWDRSKCPHCKKKIRWFDNIPVVSFVILKFRCRDCQKKISWQYPLVEIFTGIVFALIGWKFFVLTNTASWLPTAFYLFAVSSLITILVYDFFYLEIPGSVLWVSIFIAIVFGLYVDYGGSTSIMEVEPPVLLETHIYPGVLAATVAFVFFFSLSFFSKEKWMGMGDAYLVILLGLILGWPEILLALFLAFAIGATYGIIAIAFRKKKMKSQVPFAPFLVLGTFIALLFYPPIIDWYLSLFY